jgi:hypothetical protein
MGRQRLDKGERDDARQTASRIGPGPAGIERNELQNTMNPFRFLTRAFIDVFGITHPTPRQERRAAWFICTLLALILLGVAAFFLGAYRFSHR